MVFEIKLNYHPILKKMICFIEIVIKGLFLRLQKSWNNKKKNNDHPKLKYSLFLIVLLLRISAKALRLFWLIARSFKRNV